VSLQNERRIVSPPLSFYFADLTLVYEEIKMPLTIEEKDKIAEGFKAAGERFDTLEQIQNELKRNIDQLTVNLRNYGRSLMSASLKADEYLGFWSNEVQAKEFGKLIMACVYQKDMGTTGQTTGGALVPAEMTTWIIQKLGKYGKFRKHAQVVTLGSSSQSVPQVTSDLTIYCPGEGAEITKSDIGVNLVTMTPKKFCCLTVVNRELDEDSYIGLGEIVGASITRSMAKKEDECGFMGDGTSTYFAMQGIVGALRAVDDTIGNIKGLKVGSGNAYNELTLEDFEGVVAILPDDADDGAVWFCSKKFYYTVMYALARAAGVADLFGILTDKKERFFMGYPVEFVPAMPSTEANSQICCLLGDLSLGAFLGERRQLEIARSDEVLFGNDQIAIRGTERITTNVYGVGDTSEAGAIVGLITAAS
jgi:HK97 family phage major capsid protein